MTEQDELRALAARVDALERELAARGRFGAFQVFYGVVAALSLGLVFLPIFSDVTVDLGEGSHYTRSFGTLWDMAGRPAGGPAVLGIGLMGLLIVLLVMASMKPRRPGHLVAIAATAGSALLMLLLKPNTGSPPPDLTGSATLGAVLLAATVVLSVVHATQLRGRDPKPWLER
ncbi:MAG: hypothetical protein ACRDT4_22100 [Micromonosporaceae bacterium]